MLQSDAAAAARRIFAHRYAAFERMAPVFETAGIRTRHTVKPIDWYLTDLGWPERNAAYLEGAQALFIDAASRALANAGCEARDVDTIVTVSSTGIATPSLEARVAGRMGFRADVERVPVFGLGCAGGVSGLAIASRLARARPGSTVLLVAIEICTAAFRMDQLSAANMVATALFGDGAAACVRAERRGRAWRASRARASTCGPTVSTSWAGRSIRAGSASSSTAPFRPSPRSMSARRSTASWRASAWRAVRSIASPAIPAAPR